MRQHNGMRPQDVAVLLKIVAKGDIPWQKKDLAAELQISSSEISESLHRSSISGLVDADQKKKVYRQSLMEFLEHGLQYVFPVLPGTVVNGMYTAHSHPFMRQYFSSGGTQYVWPHPRGNVRGLSIEPLYKFQVNAATQDEKLYLLLALSDVIRVGRAREKKVAIEELKKYIL